MTESGGLPFLSGFLVHAYADLRRDRLYLTGRLADGRSFAAMESRWRPSFHIPREALPRCAVLPAGLPYRVEPPCLEPFSGTGALALLRFSRYRDRSAALEALEAAGVSSPDGDLKPPGAFLTEREIRGPLEIRGPSRPGRYVDLVFSDPEIQPPDPAGPEPRTGPVPLRVASIDIETDTRSGVIRAIGVVYTDAVILAGNESSPGDGGSAGDGLAGTYTPPGGGPKVSLSCVRVVLPEKQALLPEGRVVFHPDERSMLAAFFEDLRAADPDVLTGWNFLDFDFPILAKRCENLGMPFTLSRSSDEAKFFPGSGGPAVVSGEDAGAFYRGGFRQSAAALVPGRQVIDALRIVRSGPRRGDGGWSSDFSLEAVSQRVLGEGKLVSSAGTDKIAELDRLYAEDPVVFGNYCYRDAELVLRILQRTGLFRLTMERAALTGVFLDKAWTSVVSFERIYGMELRKKGIAPDLFRNREVSGAAGGTVLDPLPGFFRNVAVFDFRSLYPTIIRTFNVDPLSHARVSADSFREVVTAPNGAIFSRTPGILPALIAGYFTARRKALDAEDDTAAHVYKILMNSFYGVLGTGACRYARTELAGAITSFARKWLLISRDWFAGQGCRVLYGDTDSLFVETGLPDGAGYGDFASLCGSLAGELNRFLTERIFEEYRLESFLEMRFEKAYRRFLIPPLRAFHENGKAARGRAKGYSGLLLGEDGKAIVEVKGMEAVRSDVTPLARRVQLELLELVFSDTDEEALRQKVSGILKELRSGKLDGELVYRKRLSRPPETYTSSTPPQVKAARALGWKGRRGTVEFVWTVNGPEPASLPHARLDYDHYTDSQVLPAARSIAAALLWRTEFFPQKGRNREALENGQMELEM
ncbi:MAG: DNA polymerase II [Treponema sp.]|jgi:DNA polymerase-2|nr:DNA polymerase II [Treponema sp.]